MSLMHLTVLLPTEILLDAVDVSKIVAEAQDGFFCLLPRHVDFVAALVPGILGIWRGNQEQVLAVDAGTLVKCGHQVRISCPHAVIGASLEQLQGDMHRVFRQQSEDQKQALSALARLEAGALRRFMEFEEWKA